MLLLLPLLSWTTTLHAQSIDNVSFTVEGTVQTELAFTPGNNINTAGTKLAPSDVERFRVEVQGCRWYIYMPYKDPKVRDFDEISSDGDETYFLMNYSTIKASEEAHSTGKAPAPNVASGIVISGCVPEFLFRESAGVIWLAYASHHYFATNRAATARVPLTEYVALTPIMSGAEPLLEHVTLTLDDSYPHLPIEVLYSFPDLTKSPFRSASPPVTALGSLTNIIYEVQQTTNVAGLRLPIRSVLEQFYPVNPVASPVVSRLIRRFSIQAARVTDTVSRKEFSPTLPGTTAILDERFNRGTGVEPGTFGPIRPPPATLKGKPLPDLALMSLGADAVPANKPILLCLFDSEQRPSRRLIRQLAEQHDALRRKGLSVLGVQATVDGADSFKQWKESIVAALQRSANRGV